MLEPDAQGTAKHLHNPVSKLKRATKNQQVPSCNEVPRQPVVFGIFSLHQTTENSFTTTILDGAVRSMRTNCLGVNQIYITESSNNPSIRPLLDDLAQQHTYQEKGNTNTTMNGSSPNKNSSFVVVPGPPAVSIHYNMTRPQNERLQLAWKDDDSQKQKRIHLAHSFMWSASYLLNHTTVPYIGFNQEDAYWLSPLPNLTEALNLHPIISLYGGNGHGSHESTCFKSTSCFFASYIFRRDTLQDFLDWMDPLFKEGPLDWSLEDYVSEKKLVIPIFPMIQKVTTN